MKILAFLQNQWFKNPERVKAIMDRNPERRNQLIGTYLFMGCLTGQRLTVALGESLCDEIIWEECSKEVGGKSSASFPADFAHICEAINTHNPDVILAFGKTAGDALRKVSPNQLVIYGPHPAARVGAVEGLTQVARDLKSRRAASQEGTE